MIRFSCAAPGAATFVNLTAPTLNTITLNGEPVDPGAYDGERIALTGLAADHVLVVDAECAYSRSVEGLHRFVDPADGNVYLYIAASQPPAALNRLLSEGRDDVLRALRGQERDRQAG